MPVNQAIVLTPPGSAAIAVVRVRGPGAGEFLARHFSRPVWANRTVHGQLTDAGRIIDDPVVVLHPDGQTADVSLHGGPWVVSSTLDLLRRTGFEIITAGDGPLPDLAVDATSPLEREVLTHLPLARTELALRALLAQPAAWRRMQDQARSGQLVPTALQAVLDDRALHHLLRLPRVAIVGAPNVGKSTLANQLFAQARSITADLPGTTRDWVGGIANIDGLAVMLVDTPGQRATDDTIEHRAIQASHDQIRRADLVLHVFAPGGEPIGDVLALAKRADVILVRNKADLPDASALPAPHYPTVATTGQGIDDLRRAIAAHFACADLDPDRPRLWTDRQCDIVTRAIADPSALAEL